SHEVVGGAGELLAKNLVSDLRRFGADTGPLEAERDLQHAGARNEVRDGRGARLAPDQTDARELRDEPRAVRPAEELLELLLGETARTVVRPGRAKLFADAQPFRDGDAPALGALEEVANGAEAEPAVLQMRDESQALGVRFVVVRDSPAPYRRRQRAFR